MISKEKMKFIKSLHNKKNRNIEQLFLVEWEKNIQELFSSDFEIKILVLHKNNEYSLKIPDEIKQVFFCDEKDISQISTYENNTFWVAVVKMKENIFSWDDEDMIVVWDDLRDPGNLGTIIRICDWYGIKNLVLSQESVDFYNPKVISSTMGSFTRVQVFYTDLSDFLSQQNRMIYGAFLDWENIHTLPINSTNKKALLIGSESHGISDEVGYFVTQKITIPRIWQAESLNAWIATGIILDNFYRNI
jgi:TrmH family RNA methyltransferase